MHRNQGKLGEGMQFQEIVDHPEVVRNPALEVERADNLGQIYLAGQ